jgi:hypothetical protein
MGRENVKSLLFGLDDHVVIDQILAKARKALLNVQVSLKTKGGTHWS